MNIRYGNDLQLTELARQITNETSSMNAYIRDGNLKGAFLRAQTMLKRIEQLQARLNQIEYAKAA